MCLFAEFLHRVHVGLNARTLVKREGLCLCELFVFVFAGPDVSGDSTFGYVYIAEHQGNCQSFVFVKPYLCVKCGCTEMVVYI